MKATKIVIDTDSKGLETVLKPYQAVSMKLVWEGGSYSSRDVWKEVNKRMRGEMIKPFRKILGD